MYRPSLEKRTSEMEEMISEKNERDEASSSCSNTAIYCQYNSFKHCQQKRHTFRVLIAQCPLAHIGQLDGSLGASIHEPIAAGRMELGRGDNFGELLHVGRFDVDDVKALILDIKVPEVNTKVIAAYEGLSVTVDGDAVDVVCMGIGICLAGNGGNDGIMVCHPGELQHRRVFE